MWYTKKEIQYLCDENGKIVGKVIQDEWTNYKAYYNYELLGNYIESKYALTAVETAHENQTTLNS
jgi:hypothetical protein